MKKSMLGNLPGVATHRVTLLYVALRVVHGDINFGILN